ncbi:uncharacterized protein LOC143766920 isoform X3 [Ranitomeya variabilis]|uniref:uncharacterized protein LOC143766920 isoform X3 n=1 Tax=Ranitomeya variabilis TaxID=490064 RepID=UPI004056C4B6
MKRTLTLGQQTSLHGTDAVEELLLPLRGHRLSVQFTNQNTSEMSSQLEVAMETLINVFHTYSAREGDKFKLSRRELKDLLQNELGEYLETSCSWKKLSCRSEPDGKDGKNERFHQKERQQLRKMQARWTRS